MEFVTHSLTMVLIMTALLAAGAGGLSAARARRYNVRDGAARRP